MNYEYEESEKDHRRARIDRNRSRNEPEERSVSRPKREPYKRQKPDYLDEDFDLYYEDE